MKTETKIMTAGECRRTVEDWRKRDLGNKCCPQGDVLVVKLSGPPDRSKCVEWKHGRSGQVAVGSTIGARHIAIGEDIELLYSPDEIRRLSLCPISDDATDALFGPIVAAASEWKLRHPEHGPQYHCAWWFGILYQARDHTMLAPVKD